MPKVSNPKLTEKMVVAKIDRDYISEGDEKTRSGITWSAVPGFDYDNTFVLHPIVPLKMPHTTKVRFRVLDDDGIVYYGGWLLNDDECINQQVVLKWCERDAGATEIQVKKDDEWVTEIG